MDLFIKISDALDEADSDKKEAFIDAISSILVLGDKWMAENPVFRLSAKIALHTI